MTIAPSLESMMHTKMGLVGFLGHWISHQGIGLRCAGGLTSRNALKVQGEACPQQQGDIEAPR